MKESYNFEGRLLFYTLFRIYFFMISRKQGKLGRGASGEVRLVTNKVTGIKYACKIIAKNDTMNDAQSMSTEMEVLYRCIRIFLINMFTIEYVIIRNN